MEVSPAHCLLGLGTNLGDRAAQLDEACERLCRQPLINCVGRSTYHATAPVGGPTGQPAFLNAALRCTTQLSPDELLGVTRDVEQHMGRQRRVRWGPRTMDIDILLYDSLVWQSDTLILPHPRMALRRFVLEPACEVASDMIHPVTGWTIGELLQRLRQAPYYVAIAGTDSPRATSLARRAAEITGARLLLDPTPPPAAFDIREAAAAHVEHELRVIAARRQQLAALSRASPSAEPVWWVANYWLPHSLAVARALFTEAACKTVEAACRQALQALPAPQCVVYMGPSRGDSRPARPLPPTRAGSREADALTLDRELAHELSRPRQAPVLRIPGADPQRAVIELTAALDAMR